LIFGHPGPQDPTQHNIILIFFLLNMQAKGVDTSYPHRKLTLFHTLPVDATAAITLAAGGEWLSETLDVLFGKRDVYPGAVVLPNRSAGDAFVWYSKLFSYLYRFATVWLDTMHWQPQLGRMGMKGEGKSFPSFAVYLKSLLNSALLL